MKDFDELKSKASQARGKIVVFNAPFVTYGQTVSYRTQGAIEASKVGAVASLTRSVTPYSLYTPHTGSMNYQTGVKRIPAAAITVEDAILLQNLQDGGKTPYLELFMDCETKRNAVSRNIIADLKGSVLPHEIVVIGGHVDSWDVGEGAHDDGGGILQTWEALRLLAANGMRPRRTIRVVMWTSEENNGSGSEVYFNQHLDELSNTTFCFESDDGTLTPYRFNFAGLPSAMDEVTRKSFIVCIRLTPNNDATEIAKLMSRYANLEVFPGGAGADVAPLTNAGVPGVGLEVAGDGGTGKDHSAMSQVGKY